MEPTKPRLQTPVPRLIRVRLQRTSHVPSAKSNDPFLGILPNHRSHLIWRALGILQESHCQRSGPFPTFPHEPFQHALLLPSSPSFSSPIRHY